MFPLLLQSAFYQLDFDQLMLISLKILKGESTNWNKNSLILKICANLQQANTHTDMQIIIETHLCFMMWIQNSFVL